MFHKYSRRPSKTFVWPSIIDLTRYKLSRSCFGFMLCLIISSIIIIFSEDIEEDVIDYTQFTTRVLCKVALEMFQDPHDDPPKPTQAKQLQKVKNWAYRSQRPENCKGKFMDLKTY